MYISQTIAKLNEGGRIDKMIEKANRLSFSFNGLQMSSTGHFNDLESKLAKLREEVGE